MKKYIFFFSILLLMHSQTYFLGRIKNDQGIALSDALIENIDLDRFTYSDSLGQFLILADIGHRLRIKHINYKILEISIDELDRKIKLITLKADIDQSEEVIIYGLASKFKTKKWVNTIEEVLQKSPGIQMISRANFSLEPTIRGMNANGVSVEIDGMKIYSACVDRMDPVTNYVEVENLEKVDLHKTNDGSSISTSLNLITNKAIYESNFELSNEVTYESVSNLKRMRSVFNLGDSVQAVRASYSFRNSGDYYSGNSIKIDRSSYEKQNYMLSYRTKYFDNFDLDFSFIGDDAKDVGYPVLLMDASKAESRIYRLSLSQFDDYSTKNLSLYYNQIDHWMDDFSRDVDQRSVMQGMYMPMFGKTRTSGFFYEYDFFHHAHDYKFKLDFHQLDAFADMKMMPTDLSQSEAYLINLGDVKTTALSLFAQDKWAYNQRLNFSLSVKLERSQKDLNNKEGRNFLSSFWPNSDLKSEETSFSFNLTANQSLSDLDFLELSFSRSDRIPNHQENYSYFLYNPIDDYFYTGNPNLNTETSYQLNAKYIYNNQKLYFEIQSYFNYINNYIYGIETDESWKVYQNLDYVTLAGIESSLRYYLNSSFNAKLNMEYTEGYNYQLKEALLMIAPFNTQLSLNYDAKVIRFIYELDYYASQKRIASNSSNEDKTNSYILSNLRLDFSINEDLNVKFAIENIFDKSYHHHLSVNNLVGKGRNIYLGLSYIFADSD